MDLLVNGDDERKCRASSYGIQSGQNTETETKNATPRSLVGWVGFDACTLCIGRIFACNGYQIPFHVKDSHTALIDKRRDIREIGGRL